MLQEENRHLKREWESRQQHRAAQGLQPVGAALSTYKPSSPAWGPVEPQVPDPGCFDGTPGRLPEFLRQCRQVFSAYPNMTETRRVMYIVAGLRGRALVWAGVADSRCSLTSRSLDKFIKEFEMVLDLLPVQVNTSPHWSTRKPQERRRPG